MKVKFSQSPECLLLTLLLVITASLMVACGGKGKVDSQVDGPPTEKLDAKDVKVLKPVPEPRARYGNHSPYTVLGKSYKVLPTSKGYHEKGIASWYGKKFHGRRTSSGELYDMYVATAAHKSLPLPTYAEVTNLDNGRKLIVKINDRGPFHQGRIIDLSYGAAVLLGVTRTGTAKVEVRSISFDQEKSHASSSTEVLFQVGAYTTKGSARDVVDQLEDGGIKKVHIEKGRSNGKKIWRVRVGPITNTEKAWRYEEKIIELGLGRPHRVGT